MKAKISYYRVGSYIAGAMSDSEKSAFEHEMAQNPQLAELVEKQKAIHTSVSFEEMFQIEKDEVTRGAFFKKLLDYLLVPRFQMALSASVLCIVALVLFSPLQQEAQYRAKGSVEVVCNLNSQTILPVGTIVSGAGDTVSIYYKSQQPLFLQVWYQDDGGALKPYLTRKGLALELVPATRLSGVSSSIVLDDSWGNEKIFIMSASQPFSMEMSDSKIGFPSDEAVSIQVYSLVNKRLKK